MALYLVQHGQALPEEADPERALSEEGLREVALVADMASDRQLEVGRIEHSGKKRASQTAHVFYEELVPEYGIARVDGLGPNDDVEAYAADLDPSQNRMLVGHLPFLDRLASLLVIGAPEPSLVRFQPGGILCLDLDEGEDHWRIKWTLFPTFV